MKLITRRILFCFCIILFLASSPLVILYAFGFRYDFTQKKLIQTGIIYLTPSVQDNIKILIDGKEELNKVSIQGIFKKDFVLYNLMPKTYNIKISRENYHSWEKNLVVLPGLITYAQPLLLPSDPKTNLLLSDSNIVLWSISDKFKKIFYLKSENEKISANIYDFSKKTLNSKPIEASAGQSKKIIITPQDSKIFFAPDGKKFGFAIAAENTRIILLNSTDREISPIADFILNERIIDMQWDDSSRYFLYLNEKGEVNLYDTLTNKTKKVLENTVSFSLKNENIYYLNQDNFFFYRSPINNPLDKQQLSYVPISIAQENQKPEKSRQSNIKKRAELIISAKNTIALISPEKNLFIIDQNGVPVSIGKNIETAIFSKDGENLIFNSSFEIFTYSLENGQENLITRLSQKISGIGWYSDYGHIWFLANQTIKNIELDSRPTPNIIDFVNLPKEPSGILFADSNSIYYGKEDNNALLLYQIEIQK